MSGPSHVMSQMPEHMMLNMPRYVCCHNPTFDYELKYLRYIWEACCQDKAVGSTRVHALLKRVMKKGT